MLEKCVLSLSLVVHILNFCSCELSKTLLNKFYLQASVKI